MHKQSRNKRKSNAVAFSQLADPTQRTKGLLLDFVGLLSWTQLPVKKQERSTRITATVFRGSCMRH